MGKIYQVIVKGPRGETVSLDVSDNEEGFKRTTVGQLREKVAKRFSAGAADFKLIFLDRSLDQDSSLLSAYGIQDKSVIHLVAKLPGGGEIPEPGKGDGGMGDKGGKNRSKEQLLLF